MSVPLSGKQGLQNGLRGFLVEAMLRDWLSRRTEGFFEEGHTDALGTADSRKRRRGPELALHHLGEQGQPHRDDLAVLGKLADGLIQKGVLVPGRCRVRSGKLP